MRSMPCPGSSNPDPQAVLHRFPLPLGLEKISRAWRSTSAETLSSGVRCHSRGWRARPIHARPGPACPEPGCPLGPARRPEWRPPKGRRRSRPPPVRRVPSWPGRRRGFPVPPPCPPPGSSRCRRPGYYRLGSAHPVDLRHLEQAQYVEEVRVEVPFPIGGVQTAISCTPLRGPAQSP